MYVRTDHDCPVSESNEESEETIIQINDFRCTESAIRAHGLKFSGVERGMTNLMPGSLAELQCISEGFVIRAQGSLPASDRLLSTCVTKGKVTYFDFNDKFEGGRPICIQRQGSTGSPGEFIRYFNG